MSWVARPGVGLSAHTGDLGATLLGLTTDYAAPIMERFGLPAAELAILQQGFRPEVEQLGEHVRGLIAADMDATMLEILSAMDRAGLDVVGAAQILCSLCAGSDNWARHGVDSWAWTRDAWTQASSAPGPEAEGMLRLGRLFDRRVAQPVAAIQTYEDGMDGAWMAGRRSAWDNVAFTKAYEELGFPPSVWWQFTVRFVRQFASEAVATLRPEVLAAGYAAAQEALVAAGDYQSAGELLPLPVIAARWDTDWRAAAQALRAAGLPGRR